MPKLAKRSTPAARKIRIHIPHVTRATKVSELTVGQLIELLVQINPQLPVERKMPSPKVLREGFKEVRDLITKQKGDPGIQKLVRQMQQGILESMPDLVRQTAGAPKDGGPSPYAKRIGK